MKKKIVCLIMVTVFSVANMLGCGNNEESSSDKREDVVIGTANGSLCLAPLHVAIDNGYFEEEFKEAGVTWKVEEIDMGNISDLVASNKIDASTQLAGAMIPQIDNGLEITFTAGMHTGCTKVYTKKSSGIGAIKDLKKKKIGVPSLGDSSVVALKRALHDAGISVSSDNLEVEWVVYGLTDLPLALENGAVDAVALHDPVAYNAEKEYKFKKILDLSTDKKFAGEYCCMSFVTKKLAESNEKAAIAYTKAILKACAFVEANPKEAAKLQIDNKQCSGDLETNTKLLKSYNYSPSVSIASKTIHDASKELIRIGELKEDDPDKFVKNAFTTFDGVPDTYKYEKGKFVEKKK